MDALTFIATLFEHGAWPAAAVVIIFALRQELRELLPSIKKLKAGPVELELERIAKEAETAKKVAAQADAKASVVAAKFDEEDEQPSASRSDTESSSAMPLSRLPISDVEAKVLKAMVDSRFVTRSVSGVAKDTGFSRSVVQASYGSLIAKGLIEQTKNSEGSTRWVATALGRTIAREA